MDQGRVSVSYAKALLGWAEESNLSGDIYTQSECLLGLMNENPDFYQLLHTPMMSISEKIRIITSVLVSCAPNLIKLVVLAMKNKREKLIKQILISFQRLYREKNGIIRTHVEVASEISTDTQTAIKTYVAKHFNKSVEIDFSIKPNIIGGFILTIEDRLLDKSVMGELEKLRQEFS